MTNPPPPGNWGPQQPGPQPPHGQGQPQFGQGQWPPQQGWGQPPGPPKNNSLKWLLIGVAVLLVIAISVGATLLFTRGSGDTAPTATGTPPAPGEIASANDTGPVSIITEDPTCEPWRPIATTLSKQQKQGWDQRNASSPASAWTPEERAMHESVASAMERAADQTVPLVKMTPHRVMRELYEQSIAFWRAYSDSIASYTAIDNELARSANAASNAIVSICTAIDNHAAASRGPLVEPAESPTTATSVHDPDDPRIFINPSQASICQEWRETADKFDKAAETWVALDPNIPASQWNPDQRSSMDAMPAVFDDYADDLESLGRRSGNPTFEDFATLSAQYWRAFAKAIPSYTTADSYLSGAASSSSFIVYDACLGLES